MLLVNDGKASLKEKLIALSKEADKIQIASAFFTESEMINNWVVEEKEVTLIVSLRPPTSYFSLKNILGKIQIGFLGMNFILRFIFSKKK